MRRAGGFGYARDTLPQLQMPSPDRTTTLTRAARLSAGLALAILLSSMNVQAQGVAVDLNNAMTGFAAPFATFAALTRMVAMGIALWATGKLTVDAIGGDGTAWLKAVLGVVAIIIIYNPFFIPNRMLNMDLPRVENVWCRVGAVSLCPTTTFFPTI